LTGIIVGFLLAAAKLIASQREKFHKFKVSVVEEEATGQTHLHLRGAASRNVSTTLRQLCDST
jgi:hypothetical protein